MSEKTKPCPYCKKPIPDSGVFGLPTYTDVPENHTRECPIREVMEVRTANEETFLSEGNIDIKTWNDKIMPLVREGVLKERKDLTAPGFLYIYQAFDSVVEDTDGTLYCAVGWTPPNGVPYVHITKYEGEGT